MSWQTKEATEMKRKIGDTYQTVIHYPIQIENEKYVGKVFGYYHEESNEYNIIHSEQSDTTLLGEIVVEKPHLFPDKGLTGYWEDEKLFFYQNGNCCEKKPYELIVHVFSRNSGIIDSNVMLNKKVVISGLGSVGSLVALELARCGVGHFLLIDNDTLAYHNIGRHQLGIKDVGRFKVSAVKDKILQINPYAEIYIENKPIEYVEKRMFDDFFNEESVIVGCTDNRDSDLYNNRISMIYNAPFISIGLWERAFAGEVFYSIPGKTPCYECVFGGDNQVISNRASQNHRFYTNEEHMEDVTFEPGIAIDINFVTEIGIKLIVDLFNISDDAYIPKLINHLKQFTLICNTNDPRIGGAMAEIFSYPLQVTTSIEVDYSNSCKACKLTGC
jgi:molybdopterin/thiamine biosynthesis adenylyltransferase